MSTQTAPSKPSAGVNASSEMPKDGAGLGGNEKDGNQHTLAENTGEGGVWQEAIASNAQLNEEVR